MTPAETITVYRIEHIRCEHRAGHGPFRMPDECMLGPASPGFGLTGKFPRGLERREICAVTREQAPRWWGRIPDPERIAEAMSDGWEFVAYAVPADKLYETCGQVVFDLSDAERMGEVGYPDDLMPTAESVDDAWTWHVNAPAERRTLAEVGT